MFLRELKSPMIFCSNFFCFYRSRKSKTYSFSSARFYAISLSCATFCVIGTIKLSTCSVSLIISLSLHYKTFSSLALLTLSNSLCSDFGFSDLLKAFSRLINSCSPLLIGRIYRILMKSLSSIFVLFPPIST